MANHPFIQVIDDLERTYIRKVYRQNPYIQYTTNLSTTPLYILKINEVSPLASTISLSYVL